MYFDLGVKCLHRFIDPRPATYIGKITSDGPTYEIEIPFTDAEGTEITLTTKARQLASMSFSYEIGDEVVILCRTLIENYIIGLASELNDADLTTEFYLRLGNNIIKGRKDGTELSFISGDDGLKITHDALGTNIECTGVVSVTGDVINVGQALAPALNACTVCPWTGVHTTTVPTISIG